MLQVIYIKLKKKQLQATKRKIRQQKQDSNIKVFIKKSMSVFSHKIFITTV